MLERWEKKAEIPLSLLAVAFLVAYAWPVLNPSLAPTTKSVLNAVSWTVWAAFAADLVVRVVLARGQRVRYVVRHWYDVALVVLPLLRPLRLLRLVALIRLLDRSASRSLAGRMLVYVVCVAGTAISLGGLAVLDAERASPQANIVSYGDAVWWAMATVTTVGYGDRYPVTLEGRLVAAMLMIVGVGVVGTVTASVASWLTGRVREEQSR